MSRKKRMDTVLRVAELREKAARIDLSAAQSAMVASQAASRARLQELHALRASEGGSAAAFRAAQRTAELRAGATSEARADEEKAAQAKAEALAAWTTAAQREKALETLAARQREEAHAERERQEQRVLDDLSALWQRQDRDERDGER